ncbi:MAG: YegS/Rv2252/BmrU family lipid kinase [Oscillospiraceae bacterium]|nr:YegS/Rv2252/BmrU family lipid kinase [Oscillospiraceae bacterium]
MKHLFIINPAAGKRDQTVQLSTMIRALCEARGLDFAIRVSKRVGDCSAITRAAAESGAETRVYACGGDGTLNEVVCGAAGAANLAVTHYPCGSGNDFVKNFSEPGAFTDLERLLDPEERLLDLIQVGEDYSLSICSIGIDARIAAGIPSYKRLPLISGKRAYNLSTAVNLIQGIHRHYTVELDGRTVDGRFILICVCNGRFYGGGYEPVPEARPDDGKLEVLLVKKVSRLEVARIIGKYKAGRYAEYPEVFTHVSTDRVRIRCDREEVVNLDGEIRLGKDVEIRLSEHKLRFFYPKGLQL